MCAVPFENIAPQLAQELKIRRAHSEEDISSIARLHAHIFSNLFSGQLGSRFLRFYFMRIMNSPVGSIFVCTTGDAIVGFVAGVSSKKRLHTVRFILLTAAVVAWQTCLHPSLFLKVLRYIKRMVILKGAHDAELLSIAVAELYRKQGIGKTLVDRFEEFLRSKNIGVYEVFTDIEHSTGHRLYERLKFKLKQQIDLFGLRARVYIKIL